MLKVKIQNKKDNNLQEQSRKRLAYFEKQHRISSLAHRLATDKEYSICNEGDNFGRKITNYDAIDMLLRRYLGHLNQKTILHLAASTGIYTRYLQEEGAITIALEKNADAVKIAKKLGNNHVVQANAFLCPNKANAPTYLPFKNRSLDAFVSDNFLLSSYCPDDAAIFKDLYRILKPSGVGIIHVRSCFNMEASVIARIGFHPTLIVRAKFKEFGDKHHYDRIAVIVEKGKPMHVSGALPYDKVFKPDPPVEFIPLTSAKKSEFIPTLRTK